jgi:hypothetical protein
MEGHHSLETVKNRCRARHCAQNLSLIECCRIPCRSRVPLPPPYLPYVTRPFVHTVWTIDIRTVSLSNRVLQRLYPQQFPTDVFHIVTLNPTPNGSPQTPIPPRFFLVSECTLKNASYTYAQRIGSRYGERRKFRDFAAT